MGSSPSKKVAAAASANNAAAASDIDPLQSHEKALSNKDIQGECLLLKAPAVDQVPEACTTTSTEPQKKEEVIREKGDAKDYVGLTAETNIQFDVSMPTNAVDAALSLAKVIQTLIVAFHTRWNFVLKLKLARARFSLTSVAHTLFLSLRTHTIHRPQKSIRQSHGSACQFRGHCRRGTPTAASQNCRECHEESYASAAGLQKVCGVHNH